MNTKVIYTKKCECGNVITVHAERVSATERKYKIVGAANTEFLSRVACICWKVYSINAAVTRFDNANRGK